ncbi:MAG: hypothetical protein JO154_17945 [Chitinophaga sp.]|uniref:hypothetical protein n=1 Tax=Chitinophaga sp. TaxID=1869181 RepID=UPI0025C1E727|nr:hypothetical protein [Chitinophaga sp.]MBV8254488.1 hypothetical protein [Chitinophaga sp.]
MKVILLRPKCCLWPYSTTKSNENQQRIVGRQWRPTILKEKRKSRSPQVIATFATISKAKIYCKKIEPDKNQAPSFPSK